MNRSSAIVALVVIAAAVIAGLSATFTVHQAEQALVLQLGEPRRVISEPGLQFKIPFIQSVITFDKRVLNYDAPSAEIPTVDQKQVIVDAFARFRIVDPLLFYQTVRDETIVQQRLQAIISSNVRRALGEVPLSLILTNQRAALMAQIARQVNEEAKTFGINVLDVRLKRVDLPDENREAIFRRMQTQREQEARRIRAEGTRDAQTLRAEADKQQVVILANAQRQSEILRGQGDASATKIYNEAYGRDASFFDFYRSMQALTMALPKDSSTYVGPPAGDFFRYFSTEGGAPGNAAPAPAGQPGSESVAPQP